MMKEHMLPQQPNQLQQHPFALRIPSSFDSLRRTYWEGHNSMIEKIPLPKVLLIRNDSSTYSHSTLLECFTNFLAFGQGIKQIHWDKSVCNFDGTAEISHLCDTRMACSMMLEQVVNDVENNIDKFVTFYTTFSDGFDPTVSLVKANRHGVWTLQVSFMKSPDAKEFGNTYVMSLSGKSEDHEEVLSLLDHEMQDFRIGKCPPLHHGGLKRVVRPMLLPLLHHADQPERRETYGTKLGKGSNHARWRYCFNYEQIGHLLPSCNTCRAIVSERCVMGKDVDVTALVVCDKCSSWEFLGKTDLLRCEPPKNFPSDMIPTNGYLNPMELTVDKLKFAAITTHRNVSTAQWTVTSARAYLSFFCMSTKISDRIIDNALNVRLMNQMREENHPVLETIERHMASNPDKHRLAKLPSVWHSGRPMHSYPDSPMHLFSGVVKAVMGLSLNVLAAQNKKESFMKVLKKSKQIETIELLNISWFPLMVVKSERFPGFGSENYIALGRYLKILGLHLKYVTSKPPTVFPPDSTQASWNKNLNVEWLKLRDLDSTGDAGTVRERVSEYVQSENCPTISRGISLSIENLQRLYASTHNVLSHLMAASVNDAHIDETHFHIIRLLNDIDQVDTHIRKLHGGKPIWAQRYNLLCLLNCKEDMKRYGPARCRWEGNDSGEKNVQPIKNSFNGFRTNWELHTHKNYFVGKTMNKLQLNEEKNARLESKERSILHLYSCPEDALSAYLLKKPLFIVRLTNSDFGVLHTSNRFWKLSGFEFKNEIVHACHFDLKLLSDTQKDVSMSESMIANVCLAIPFESLYVILDMEWKELDSDLNFNYGYK